MAETLQGGVAKFDPKTQKFTTWSMPPDVNNDSTQINMVAPGHDDVDGKVWLLDAGSRDLHRLDLATGKIETIVLYPGGGRGHMSYDVDSDSQNNAYATDMSSQTIVKVDAKTLEITPVFDAYKGYGAASRRDGRTRPILVWRIPWKWNWNARYPDRALPRVASARTAHL